MLRRLVELNISYQKDVELLMKEYLLTHLTYDLTIHLIYLTSYSLVNLLTPSHNLLIIPFTLSSYLFTPLLPYPLTPLLTPLLTHSLVDTIITI